ncbi:MAG: hypothetical protein NVSMB21_17010 [Vulcanimicrobiaceae bacterium]
MIHEDLRFGVVPLPAATPGYDPAGDARALVPRAFVSPAANPIPGHQLFGSFGPGSRYVVRVPLAWNGDLAVCGTPAMRSEHANDAILGDYLLARGFAFASSNKGIPYNASLEAIGPAGIPERAYRVPFPLGEAAADSLAFRMGTLDPQRVPLASWQEDLPRTIRAATEIVRELMGRRPRRTYALGLSIGGGQVRYLLERYPELADGGLEWASVYWHPDENILTYLPAFLRAMPAYVASGYRDDSAHASIVAAGFPPDRLADDRRSLWDAHYGALPPFYADLTVFTFGTLLEPHDPQLGSLAARARYVPSVAARAAIATLAHTGAIERPLVAVAGDADVFITPHHHFASYAAAVRAAGRGALYHPYLVPGGTHVDGYADPAWGLRAQLPFAWSGFERLVAIVERGERTESDGAIRIADAPEAM